MVKGLLQVFQKIQYSLLAGSIALVIFSFIVLFPNLRLLIQILSNQTFSFGAKMQFVFSLFGSIQTNFTFISATYTILIAVLFGMNIAMFAYYIRRQRAVVGKSNSALGVGGLVSGIFGIGCASCGTFILTWALGFFGATGLIAFLPLGGEEFGILGVILLLYSVVTIAKKISSPQVCVI
jgi:hypothetical protein